jgi:hypothetical protein
MIVIGRVNSKFYMVKSLTLIKRSIILAYEFQINSWS